MVLIKFVNWVREFIGVCLCDLWWRWVSISVWYRDFLMFLIRIYDELIFFVKIFINKMDIVNIPNPKYSGLVHCQTQNNISLANILGLKLHVSGELA